MIDAKIAKSISDANSSTTKTLKEIESLIRQAATDGDYSIEYYGCISDSCKDKLIELGYDVIDIYQRYGDADYLIKW